MDMQLIECGKIAWPKSDRKERSFSKEVVENLARSIRDEGLLQPILVRPHPDKPGHFLGVAGRHRHHAVQKILREPHIAACVAVEMDDMSAEMAAISENLWRNPLTKSQSLKAIQRWWEHYRAKYPDNVGRGHAGSVAAAKKRREGGGQGRSPLAEAGSMASSESGETEGNSQATEDPKCTMHFGEENSGGLDDTTDRGESGEHQTCSNFAELLSATSGMSKSQAIRYQRLVMIFTPDQLEVFEQMQVGQVDKLTISRIEDEASRGAVVNLIAAGREPADAMREVMGDAAPAPVNGSARSAENTPDERLTDDAWFDLYCGKLARRLHDSRQPGYRAEALLYRRTEEARHAFRRGVKKEVAAIKGANPIGGWFYKTMNRMISFSHPKDWLLCGECNGTGQRNGRNCQGISCFGTGFIPKTEKYL